MVLKKGFGKMNHIKPKKKIEALQETHNKKEIF